MVTIDPPLIPKALSIVITCQLLKEVNQGYCLNNHPNAKAIFKNNIEYASSLIECLKNADCCTLITEWEEFKKLKPEDFIQKHAHTNPTGWKKTIRPRGVRAKNRFMAIGLT